MSLVRQRSLPFLLILFTAGAVTRQSPAGGMPDQESSKAGHTKKTQALKGIDLDGKLHHFCNNDRKVVGIVFLSTGCPISNTYVPRLNELAKRFTTKRSVFYGVMSDSSISRAEALAHRKKYRVVFPVLFDASGNLRHALRPTHAPQAFVLDDSGTVLYSGLIDNLFVALGQKRLKVTQHYLSDAMQQAIRGRKPTVRSTVPIGCLTEDPNEPIRPGKVTYCRDIAPILLAHCASCHRPGESGPFPLLTYDDAKRRARQIAAVTKSRLMPPWKAAAGFGHFQHERRLSEREIELIDAWTRGGKPRGDAENLPATPQFVSGWRLGKPDLVLRMKQAVRLPAHGPDVYRYVVIPTGLRTSRLISAVEFRPGNPRVAHHATILFDNSGMARKLDAATSEYGYNAFGGPGFLPTGTLGSWVPGSVPQRLPKGMGRWLPGGTDLILQMHYQCSGKAETDQSSIGIYFAGPSARQVVDEIQVLNSDLSIPPGAKRFKHTASFTLPVNVIIIDAAPHLHLIGREIKVTATLPNGKTKPLIWVKDWDFNWQDQYHFAKPIRLPRGTRINVTAWLDNSAGNPMNPNSPPKRVKWGEQTSDEMPLCRFCYTTDSLGEFQTMKMTYRRYMIRQFPPSYVPNLQSRQMP